MPKKKETLKSDDNKQTQKKVVEKKSEFKPKLTTVEQFKAEIDSMLNNKSATREQKQALWDNMQERISELNKGKLATNSQEALKLQIQAKRLGQELYPDLNNE